MLEIKEILQEVDDEIKEEAMKKAKHEIKAKRREIAKAEKYVNQLKLEEKDILSRLSEGV